MDDVRTNGQRVRSELRHRYREMQINTDAPRGPAETQRLGRLSGATFLGSALLYVAGGAATVALVSNPIGWWVGATALGVGLLGSPAGVLEIGTARRPKMGNKEEAIDRLVAWLEAQGFVVEGRVVKPISFRECEDRYRIRAYSDFNWMEADMLRKMVQSLNACRQRTGEYYNNPDIRKAISKSLPA